MRKRMNTTIKSKAKLKVSGRKITILPKPIDPDDTLTPAEAKKVRLGMKQIREGKFKLWPDVKHELGR
jgi:hypothetical protein